MDVFRNDTNQYLTRSLFVELATVPGKAMYTLRRQDHESYPSLYRLYMEMADVTEFKFANEYLAGWEHWKVLLDSNFFKPHILAWREELTLQIHSEYVEQLKLLAKTPSQAQLTAIKYLMERGWLEKPKQKAGRPSEDRIKKEAEALFQQSVDEDRILSSLRN